MEKLKDVNPFLWYKHAETLKNSCEYSLKEVSSIKPNIHINWIKLIDKNYKTAA